MCINFYFFLLKTRNQNSKKKKTIQTTSSGCGKRRERGKKKKKSHLIAKKKEEEMSDCCPANPAEYPDYPDYYVDESNYYESDEQRDQRDPVPYTFEVVRPQKDADSCMCEDLKSSLRQTPDIINNWRIMICNKCEAQYYYCECELPGCLQNFLNSQHFDCPMCLEGCVFPSPA